MTSDDRSPDSAVRHWLSVARAVQSEANQAGLGGQPQRARTADAGGTSTLGKFDELVTSAALRSVSRKLFEDGHYARAVEEAFKCLNNAVKDKAELPEEDGSSLMRRAFSLDSPILLLNELRTRSDRAEQVGYMDLFAGAITGIRNPRAHEHDLDDHPDVALELLALANHLMRKLAATTTAS